MNKKLKKNSWLINENREKSNKIIKNIIFSFSFWYK